MRIVPVGEGLQRMERGIVCQSCEVVILQYLRAVPPAVFADGQIQPVQRARRLTVPARQTGEKVQRLRAEIPGLLLVFLQQKAVGRGIALLRNGQGFLQNVILSSQIQCVSPLSSRYVVCADCGKCFS